MGYNIEKEKFEFAGLEKVQVQRQENTKSHGYFADAGKRFLQNKASIVAGIIIILIILFSLLVPLFIRNSSLDSYYAKKGAKIESLSFLPFFDGGKKRSFNERGIIHAYAIGLGASDTSKISEIPDEYRTVITDTSKVISSKKNDRYTAEIDTYSEVGFVYMQFSEEEFKNIINWQNEHDLQILFPLIENNNYNPDTSDANYWYRTDPSRRNTPIDADGKKISFSENMALCDNYQKDIDGNLVYYRTSAGTSPIYYVRVLYRNYYIYKNGHPVRFLLGTDSQGYDMALRLSQGIRLSLFLSISVFIINFIIGAVYGAVEGYYGGAYDLILERISDILSCVPFIVVATLFQLHLSDRLGIIPSLLFAFVLTGWISTASRVRSQFYRFKNREYVMSARTLGASDRRIILKHIFPNALGTLVTSSVLIIPAVILNESMLSFLGIVNLGAGKTTSLGTLLSESANIWTNFPHLMILPALVISLLMICFNLFSNGLRDALDPSLRGSEV